MTLDPSEELRQRHQRLNEIEQRIDWMINLLVSEARADQQLRIAAEHDLASLRSELQATQARLSAAHAREQGLMFENQRLAAELSRRR